jgi:hypothetical protein
MPLLPECSGLPGDNMIVSHLEILFRKLCRQSPTKTSIKALTDHPDREQVSDFLLDKLRELLEMSKSGKQIDEDLEWGVINSLPILREMKAEEAIEPMIDLMDDVAEDPMAMIHNAISIALKGAGRPAMELILERYERDLESEERTSTWLWALSWLGVKDKRIYEALLEHFHNDTSEAVQLMGYYADKRFLPLVKAYVQCLANYFNDNKINPLAYGARLGNPFVYDYIEARDAQAVLQAGPGRSHDIYDENVEAIDRRLLKYADVDKHKRGLNEILQDQKKEKVGRNDPCPCGSGKKYKHCCIRIN